MFDDGINGQDVAGGENGAWPANFKAGFVGKQALALRQDFGLGGEQLVDEQMAQSLQAMSTADKSNAFA
jgi:hypothetical protein